MNELLQDKDSLVNPVAFDYLNYGLNQEINTLALLPIPLYTHSLGLFFSAVSRD